MNPEILLGPPGTGKTTSLLDVVDGELARGVAPDRIAYVTFTRRGAEEAITRAVSKFKLSRSALPYFRTLHSLCYRQLGLTTGDVVDQKKLADFGDWAGVRITGRWSEDGTITGFELGDRIMFLENLARVRMISVRELYDQDDDNLPWLEVDRVCRAYTQYKTQNGLLDYTDMLYQFVRSSVRINLEVLIDDEAQDQSLLQWNVIRKLAVGARRVVIAGDDDQCIYRWAGADVDSLIDLPGSARTLGKSWRVPANIQALAASIIEPVAHRRPKVWTPRAEGGVITYSRDFDVEECGAGQVLVLTRNIYLLREIVQPMLQNAGLIYEYNGHPSIPRSILNAIVNWEQLRAGEAIPVKAARDIYDHMSSGTGVARGFKTLKGFADEEMVTMADLKARGGLLVDGLWHNREDKVMDRIPTDIFSYMFNARKRGEKLLTTPRIRISTIHGSKGGEADHVILFREMAKRTFKEMEQNEDSERRVWYVGATRAKEHLTIVSGNTPQACMWL